MDKINIKTIGIPMLLELMIIGRPFQPEEKSIKHYSRNDNWKLQPKKRRKK